MQCCGTQRRIETGNLKLEIGKEEKALSRQESPTGSGVGMDRLLSLFFFVRDAYSARAAERPLRHVNQGAQGRIDGLLVRKVLSNVRREEHEIRSCSIARGIFAANGAFQFRQVVLSAQFVAPCSFLRFFLHSDFVRAASSYVR